MLAAHLSTHVANVRGPTGLSIVIFVASEETPGSPPRPEQPISLLAAQPCPRPIQPGSRVGVVVRALAFHQCVPGSIRGPGVICGLSLLVLYSAPRGFSPGTPVFPSPQKPTFDLI